MFLLFEDAGKLLTGRQLSEAESSTQVELDSGKRIKVKNVNILLRFDRPSPALLLERAQVVSHSIELELAWEFSPDEEFGFTDLAAEYFGSSANQSATLEQQAGTLVRLFETPHYFRRSGKGRFRKVSAEVLALALAAIEKKKQIALQTEQWALALGQGECPAAVREQLYKILFKPDKNAAEYKAVVAASRATQLGPLELLIKAGAIESPYQFHWKRFLLENFPKGTGFPKLEAPFIRDDLPLSSARAFSIDDSATTEIDDALSLQGLGSGSVCLGIHIAAPGLVITPGSPIDVVGRQRLSTVYMPGYKVTMLPDDVVQSYTLQEGRDCPAVSLYVTLDEATLEIRGSETRVERVHIEANLRHDQLDSTVTAEWLEDVGFAHEFETVLAPEQRRQLSFLYRLAKDLKSKRELVRGKPEVFNRPDYNFKLIQSAAMAGTGSTEPQGDEQVVISVRKRGAPLDMIVAEAMILANSSWGAWMAELGVPGIYRSQASLLPGVKVRMGTKALPHAGIGVKSYAWSTSPLRRYTDLVNQWQIIACVRHGKTAALAAPFRAKDADLFSIISSFDAAYSAYNSYQAAMERFWTLKYVQQNAITEITAMAVKDNLVRADYLPLVLPVVGGVALPRGVHVRVKLGEIDEVTLSVVGSVLERLEAPGETERAEANRLGEDDEDSAAGPISIAVDVNESDGDAAAQVQAPVSDNSEP